MGTKGSKTNKSSKKVLINLEDFLFGCIKDKKTGFSYKCGENQCINYYHKFLLQLLNMAQTKNFKNEYITPPQRGNDHRHLVNDSKKIAKITEVLKNNSTHYTNEWIAQSINEGLIYQTTINAGGVRLFYRFAETDDYFEVSPLFLDLHHVIYSSQEGHDEQHNYCMHCLRNC